MSTIHKGHRYVDDAMRDACLSVLESHRYYLGMENDTFEREVAEFLGVKHAISVNSGSSAMFLILQALGIGEGDEVLVQSSGFVTLAEAVANTGARPRFIDVELETYNLDPSLLEAALTPNVKAIVPAHTYGHPAAMADIKAFAQRHHLYIIEDCCHAFGAVYHGEYTGSLGDAGFLSFAGKGISVCGLGGMALTNDDGLAAEVRLLRDHGRPRSADGSRFYEVLRVGYNLRLSELHAALGRVQLGYLSEWNKQRRANAQRYNELFTERGLPIHLPVTKPNVVHAFLHYTIRVMAEHRDPLKAFLAERGIESSILYPTSQHLLPPYQTMLGCRPGDYSCSEQMTAEILSLPNHPSLTEAELNTVADAVTAYFEARGG
jgi:dTDP-4-amino-4,6-dideoxygalactose transaminase